MSMSMDFLALMREALREAEKGSAEGEVPVGAVVAREPDGEIIARAYNQPIALNDPTAHAEILALRRAGACLQNYRIKGATLVVTIEPCLMCIGAVIQARVSRLVFGAFDAKAGAAGSLYNIVQDSRLNHRVEVVSGIMEEKCRKVIQDFFLLRRQKDMAQGEVPKWS